MFVSYSPYMTFGAKWLRKSRKINNPDASVGVLNRTNKTKDPFFMHSTNKEIHNPSCSRIAAD